jgi:signal peptidase I
MKEVKIKPKKEPKEKKDKSFFRELVEWIFAIAAALVIAILVKYFIFTPTLVKQKSMTPTILDGERVVINRLTRTFKIPLFRGQIVTFERPDSTDYDKGVAEYVERTGVDKFVHDVLEINKTSYIKRVIGLSGDKVVIANGSVYVNDMKLSEVYLNGIETPRLGDFWNITVPEGYVFAMGDNRGGSTDCRYFGCIPLEKIEGTVKYRFWPLNKIGAIDE